MLSNFKLDALTTRHIGDRSIIIKVRDLYYMCCQGAWFMGCPNGPWEVGLTDVVSDDTIAEILASTPGVEDQAAALITSATASERRRRRDGRGGVLPRAGVNTWHAC